VKTEFHKTPTPCSTLCSTLSNKILAQVGLGTEFDGTNWFMNEENIREKNSVLKQQFNISGVVFFIIPVHTGWMDF